MEEDMNMMMVMKQQTPTTSMAPPSTSSTTTSSSSALAMHNNSHTISKVKPKIRIIHIFAPEIIKTDVANFRELVQRLTGKPTENDMAGKKKQNKKKPRIARKEDMSTNKVDQLIRTGFDHQTMTGSESSERSLVNIKEECSYELWSNGHDSNYSSSGGFLGGFADLDGFSIQEFGEFPFDAPHSTHNMHVFDQEPQLIA